MIDDWKSDILRTQDKDNEQKILQKYKNIRLLDDEDNQTYMIYPENLEFKGPTRRNNKYFVVGKPLNRRDGENTKLITSRDTNDDFMLLIKGVEQDPDLGVKTVHTSIYDDSEAADSDKEENNDDNAFKKPHDGGNINDSSDYEGDNYEDDLETPYDGENINAYPNNEKIMMRLPLNHLKMMEL